MWAIVLYTSKCELFYYIRLKMWAILEILRIYLKM
jgi:hypothetical protein